MEKILYDMLKTEYKYGKPVLMPSGEKSTYNEKAVDCPFVFWHNHKYYILNFLKFTHSKL